MRALAVVLCCAVTLAARAATLDPPDPQLGERALLVLEAAPADSTEMPRGQNVVLRATGDPLRFQVIPVRVGAAAIALPASEDTLRWEVQPRLAQATPDSLRPLDRVGEIGPDYRAHVALLLLALAALAAWWWRRRVRAVAPSAFEIPSEPPHERALQRLARIRDEDWIARGEFERFYVEASHALRDYVGGRFRVPALDWTTTETVDGLLDAGYARDAVGAVDPLLRAADEVKFAGARPSPHQAERWIDDAREWIEATAVPVVHSTPEALQAARELHGGGAR